MVSASPLPDRPHHGQDLFAPPLLWPLIMSAIATSTKSKLTSKTHRRGRRNYVQPIPASRTSRDQGSGPILVRDELRLMGRTASRSRDRVPILAPAGAQPPKDRLSRNRAESRPEACRFKTLGHSCARARRRARRRETARAPLESLPEKTAKRRTDDP